ncbi:MAG TPA: aspartate kinase [Clostridiaceae bacterium]|nr:aspartate kinase [Clostridiaceae bacterium]
MIVTKFGGSSCANSLQFRKIKDIIESEEQRKVVVVSAPGKHSGDNFKITDTLYLCYQLSREQLDESEIFEEIANRYRTIHSDLGLSLPLEKELDTIKKNLTAGAGEDYVVSRGEYLNALLMAEFLGYDFVDAKDLIVFTSQHKYDKISTYKLLKEFSDHKLPATKGIVVPGFYGATEKGEIVTFPRGGSDITGAILAAGLQADLYENWTDVPGFLVADPKIIDKPKIINSLSYVELRELSYSDSQIIQADAISATRDAEIPLLIKNTNYPENPGTMIHSGKKAASDQLVTGIAGQQSFTVIHLKKYGKNEDYGFLRKICTIFEAHKITIHHMPTSLDTISIIFHIDDKKELEQIVEQINLYCRPDQSSYEQDMALITVVGESMAYQPGIAGKIFSALGSAGVNIRMITQGSSEYNIIIGIESHQYNLAIQTLYDYFFSEGKANE